MCGGGRENKIRGRDGRCSPKIERCCPSQGRDFQEETVVEAAEMTSRRRPGKRAMAQPILAAKNELQEVCFAQV